MAIRARSQLEQIRSDITIANSKVTLKALSLFVELHLRVVKGPNLGNIPIKIPLIFSNLII